MIFSKRARRITVFSVILVAVLLFCVFLLPEVIVLTLPFIIAFLLAKLIEPLVVFLNRRVKIPRKLASGILVILVVSGLIWLLVAVGSRIADEISYLVSHTDEITSVLTQFFKNVQNFLNGFMGGKLSQFFGTELDMSAIGEKVSSYVNGYVGPAIQKMVAVVKSLPNVLVFIVVLILGTYFISSDNEKISEYLEKATPEFAKKHFTSVKRDMSKAFFGYIRAQLLLMTITFFECTIGFLVIGGSFAKYALLLGLSISVIDMFPVLGTGTVLIPWGLYCLVTGNIRIGISLLILYGICLLVRQLLEPKIVGKQIGIHPLVTLMTMYAGLRLIGFAGMILGPILALVFKNLAESGFFRVIKNYLMCNEENSNEEV